VGEARLSFFSEPSPFISSIFLCFEMQNDKKKEAFSRYCATVFAHLSQSFFSCIYYVPDLKQDWRMTTWKRLTDCSMIFPLAATWDTVEDGLVPDSHAIIVHVIGVCIRVKPRLDGAVTGSVGIVVTAFS
jgi:hypothetical protein